MQRHTGSCASMLCEGMKVNDQYAVAEELGIRVDLDQATPCQRRWKIEPKGNIKYHLMAIGTSRREAWVRSLRSAADVCSVSDQPVAIEPADRT